MHHNWGFSFFFIVVAVVVVVSLLLLFDCSFASDTLTLNQTLADGKILVSADKRFQLGFFSPGNSTKRYVGIWYTVSPEIVVWVANREKPVTGLSGYLRVSSGGQLAVLDQAHHVLWSSKSSKLVYDPVARILDNGNLIVEERSQVSSATYAWQSFDYPTDTALPGFVIGRDSSEDQDASFLSSWKSTEDPSPGATVFRFDYSGTSQMVVEEGSTRKYRTGPWNGLRFSGLSFYSTPTVKPLVMIFDKNKLCGAYFLYNSSSAGRLVLGSTGVLSLYILDEGRSQWRFFHSLPTDPCDNYGQCGVNGFCSLTKQSLCDCLKGFTPKNPQTWAKLDFSAGCNRSVPLACGKGDGFLKLVGVKLPDMLKVWLNTSMSLQECGAKCLANCSCTAYANSNISGRGSGCLLWFGDLIDIREYHDKSSEQEMYLRLSASELRSGGSFRKKRLEMAIAFPVITGMLILVSLCWSIFWRKQRTARGEDLLTFDFNVKQRTPEAADKTKRLVRANKDESELEIPVFNLSSVSACTDNFSAANKLGEGGFGPVYKGILLNGHEVAVKRLSVRSKQGWEELKNEAVLIAKLQHKNLVKLLGCCIEGEEHILIYEYLPNKSLDIFLFDTTKSAMLDWASRVHIIKGIAQGLLYLHEYSRLKIIHRDLKASNILLDEDMNPKISDFGLARIFGGVDEGATGRIVGTYGYMAPEYASHGIFSVKSDVFSFGVLMLEILSGKKNTGFHRSDYLNLLGYAWDLWTSKRALELKDPTLQDTNCVTTDSFFTRNVNIALLCVQEKAVARPTMSEVVSMISNEHSPLPCPKRPAFVTLRNVVNPVSDSSTSDTCSVNLVTSSTIQAR